MRKVRKHPAQQVQNYNLIGVRFNLSTNLTCKFMKKNQWYHTLSLNRGCQKLLLIMKLSFVISLVFAVTVSANTFSQNGRITINLVDVTVKDVIKSIEAGSDYRFFYNDELTDISKVVSVNYKETQISDVLNALFQNTGITYKVLENNLIVIAPQTAIQPAKVTGTVTDASTGEPLPGVNILIEGTNSGVATDVNGKFSLEVDNPNAVLVFSYIGYLSQKVPVGGKSVIDINLIPDVKALDEVVVIGYGSIKKNDLTGSVGSVSSETLTAKGTTSIMSAIQGSVAGVNITTTSAKAGGDFSIQIRGQNSVTSKPPLYVVDGIVTDDLNFLNPSDIERIDILKDASSTAIYGSRGSNGVVLVTTKNANVSKESKLIVTYDGYYGVRKLAHLPDFMDGREWIDFRTTCYYTWDAATQNYVLTTANQNGVLNGSTVVAQRLYEEDYEDWLGLGTRDGKQQNHYINISGGANNIAYNIGLGYQNEEGNFIRESLDRYNAKVSISHKASDFFQSGANFNFAQTTSNAGSEYGYRDLMRLPSIFHAYRDDGTLITQPGIKTEINGTGNFTSSTNPLLEIASGVQETRREDLIGSVFAQVSPIKGLDFKSTISIRYNRTRVGKYYGVVPNNRTIDNAVTNNAETFDYTWDNQLSYSKTIGNHNIGATIISSVYRNRYESLNVQTQDLPYKSYWYNIYTGDLVSDGSKASYSEKSLLSYTGRLNYDFKSRYLLTATLRYDGSSVLRDKWTAFPSFAVAWRASEEPFMDYDWLSNLKFRFSFGYSGNNNIDAYSAQLVPVTKTNILYDYNGTTVSGFAPGSPINKYLTWEKTREINLGIDYGVLKGRINGTIELYNKLSDGLLLSRTLTYESGVKSMTDNIGSVRNKGIEISLNTVNINARDFQWTTSFTYARNKNAWVTIYGEKEDVIGESRFIGKPINVIYDYKVLGVWTKAEYAAGKTEYRDASNNLVYKAKFGEAKTADTDKNGLLSAADKVILGSPDPKWTGSITSTMQYKWFDFSFNIYTKQGVFLSDKFTDQYGYNTQRGMAKVKFDYYVPPETPIIDWNNFTVDGTGQASVNWTTTGAGHENSKYPIYKNINGAYYGGNGNYQDASFVKVKNITIGCTLPEQWTQKAGISSLRVYFNVLNPFTFTDYVGWDPEYAATEMQNGNGPSSITWQGGVNVKF
jgi:TonB-dependent starch-binding outer membrane protein SusC